LRATNNHHHEKPVAATSPGHLKAVAGNALLPSLTHQHLDRYTAKRLTDGVSPVTVNVELRALRSIMNVALRWELIEKNPFTGLKLMTVPEVLPQYLSKQDFQKLFSIIKEGWLKEVVGFAVLTGLRRGEILNLRWSDVDLTRRVIQIHSSGTFKTKHGKRRTVT
jgi:integrase